MVVGGGIVGLTTALALRERTTRSIVLLEKEDRLATHQTGRNSGVIHSGIYYAPGSLKARLGRAGNASVRAFAAEHGVPHEVCGKLIVATRPDELPRLDALLQRAHDHGLEVERLGPEGLRAVEPHADGLAALRVPSTGIVDYVAMCAMLARLLAERGVEVRVGTPARLRPPRSDRHLVELPDGTLEAGFLVTCGGLQSDRLARAAGAEPGAQVVPFRGEFFELVPARTHLVRGLIYPVPDPAFPFLGVHLTRTVAGGVHAGPNAVLALAREGYTRGTVDRRDLVEMLRSRGLRRLARRHAGAGAREVARSLSKRLFLHSLQRLVPELRAADLVAAPAGVRAQAVSPDGTLVDDFLLVDGPASLHVCNAPSPAATASLEIGRAVAERVLARLDGG